MKCTTKEKFVLVKKFGTRRTAALESQENDVHESKAFEGGGSKFKSKHHN